MDKSRPSATPSLDDVLQGSNDPAISTRNVQRTCRPQLQKKAHRRFAEAMVLEPENDLVRLFREQDKNLVRLLSRMVKTELRSNEPIFDFEKKGETSADFVTKQPVAGDLQAEGAEVTHFKINRAGENTLSFKQKAGDARHGNPASLVLSRELAAEHCAFVRDAILKDSTVDTIVYEEDIDGSTVSRFVACISPASRSALPTHDVVEIFDAGHQDFLATKIEWSMKELEDLYMFAHTMGAFDVCDMVIDRVHGELHHAQQRLIHSTNSTTTEFKIFGISPAFLNFLSKHEKKGFDFFADVLVMTTEDTLELLKTYGLSSWHQRVKRTLIEKLESDETLKASKNDAAAICSKYHHHQGPGTGCYRSKEPEALVMIASAPRQLPSPPRTPKKRVKPPNREESSRNSKRRKLCANRLVSQKIGRKAKKASGRVHSGSNDGQAKTRLQETHQELYDDRKEYMESSDSEHSSDDEGCNAAIARLPEVYSKTRDLFRNSAGKYEEPYVITQLPSGLKQGRRATRNVDGSKYRGKGMNLVKDTAEMQRKKVAIVKERLQMFRDYGYGSDSEKA